MGNIRENIPALSANSSTAANWDVNSFTAANYAVNSLTVTNKTANSLKTANYAVNNQKVVNRAVNRLKTLTICILCYSSIAPIASAQVPLEYRITESVVSAKAPKKLRTYIPFWGVPLRSDGIKESYGILEDCVACFDVARHNGQADAGDLTQDTDNSTDAAGSTQDTDEGTFGNGDRTQDTDEGTFGNGNRTVNDGKANKTSRRLRWLSWNLDLASTAEDRYKFQRFVKDAPAREVLMQVIDECYRWAWRKPYGNTNLTMGPLYTTKRVSSSGSPTVTSDRTADSTTASIIGSVHSQNTAEKVQYGWFVAVCKQERVKGPAPLGYTSVAFVIPAKSSPGKNIYDMSRSVNGVEYISGYNLFPKLPLSVQEQVEEITVYELFCPFQEIDEDILLELVPEFDGGEFNEPFDKE